MKRTVLMRFRIIASILSVVFIACYMITFQEPVTLRGKGTKENPYMFSQNTWYSERVSELAVDGDYIYLLFPNKGVVKCYRTDGTYLHSYYFTQRSNGRMSLFRTDDALYISNRDDDFFRVSDGNVVEFLDRETPQAEAIHSLVFHSGNADKTFQYITDSDGAKYTLEGMSIIRNAGASGEKTVIRIPLWTFFFSSAFLWGMGMLCFVAAWLLGMKIKKMDKNTNSAYGQ